MRFTLAICAAIAVAALGSVILWANPRRRVNRTVFTCSLHGVLWLVLRQIALVAEDGLFWYRCTIATGAFFPFHLWLVKQSVAAEAGERFVEWWRRGLFWVLAPAALAVIAFTEYFIPAHSTEAHRVYGAGYYIHIVGLIFMYVLLGREMYVQMKSLSGVRRLEMQIWLGGGIGACGCVVALMAATAITGNTRLNPLGTVVVICFFAATTLAITTSRVFDAKYLLFIALQRVILVLVVAASAFIAYSGLVIVFPTVIAVLGTTALALGIAGQLSRWLNRALQLYPRGAEARSKALGIAMGEMRQEPLKQAFIAILRGWARTDAAYILLESEGTYSGAAWASPANSRLVELLKELGWATVERLFRERETPDRVALRELMEAHSLGAIVVPKGLAFSILVAVGIRSTRRPFTYPEIQQLIELASIFQTALARSYLWTKAQRAEQLATVGMLGASVAHEIRNPLVTIKSFVHLLPQHYDDRAFRERFFRLIGEEVGRIDRLTEQLLDLASPRHYNPAPTSLHQVIISSLDLVATKADERRVALHHDLLATPDTVVTDANAARQVLLNLCFNGIQAQEQGNGDRWVRVATRKVNKGIELCVADNGPGIPAESRAHLFQAFHSTKSSGFGLGLVICHEILSSLDASIAVDPFVSGEGARFRIVFPCPQPTS